MGSQSAPPIYQYRLVMSQEDKLVNIATDMDMNIEGEVKYPIRQNLGTKTKFQVSWTNSNILVLVVYKYLCIYEYIILPCC